MNDKMSDSTLSRDLHGRFLRLRSSAVTRKDIGNGVEYAASFDAVNRLTALDWKKNSTLLAGYTYAYTPAGNRKYEEKLHDPDNSQLYKYDTIYQVDNFRSGKLNRPKTNIIRPDRRQDWNYTPR